MIEIKPCILKVTEQDVLENQQQEYPDLVIEGPGYYYLDETENLGGGPFQTVEEAEIALKAYAEWLG